MHLVESTKEREGASDYRSLQDKRGPSTASCKFVKLQLRILLGVRKISQIPQQSGFIGERLAVVNPTVLRLWH